VLCLSIEFKITIIFLMRAVGAIIGVFSELHTILVPVRLQSALRDDQTSPGPLRIILGHQLIRDLRLVLSPGARYRPHNDAIFELQIAKRIGCREHVCWFG
jgi:hypothetical protein